MQSRTIDTDGGAPAGLYAVLAAGDSARMKRLRRKTQSRTIETDGPAPAELDAVLTAGNAARTRRHQREANASIIYLREYDPYAPAREEDGLRTPPRIAPIPKLIDATQQIRDRVKRLEDERAQRMRRLDELELKLERQQIAEGEVWIQSQLKETGDRHEQLRIEAGIGANTRSEDPAKKIGSNPWLSRRFSIWISKKKSALMRRT